MTVVDPRLAGKPVPRISRETMERGHTARASAKGSDLAFLDQRLPAYEREIINMLGMGVTENRRCGRMSRRAPKAFPSPMSVRRRARVRPLHRHATEEVFTAAGRCSG